METWRLLIDSPQSAAVNMATDEAIAIAFWEQKVRPTLRFYQWVEASFSIGRFQKLNANWIRHLEKDPKSGGFTLVRRMTGGRGLLHDREFTYSLISENRHPLFSSGIKGSYLAISKGLLLGLKQIGVNATSYKPRKQERKPGHQHPLCFTTSSWYEITAGDRKLIGSAQRRWATHFLQHGSLILEQSPLLSKHSEWLGMPLVSENQVTLSSLLPSLPSNNTLLEAMKAGFESALSIRLEEGEITPYEQTLAKRLVRGKYGHSGWNFRRDSYSGRDAQNSR